MNNKTKQEIINVCERRFNYSKRMQVLRTLMEMDVEMFIAEHNDGCRINLDKLNENQLTRLYSKVKALDEPAEWDFKSRRI